MIKKIARRLKIKASIRTKVSGTAERPRLTVFFHPHQGVGNCRASASDRVPF